MLLERMREPDLHRTQYRAPAAAGAARAAGSQDASDATARQDEPEHAALHLCGLCGGERVYPLDWMEESPERWRIALRCPDCEHMREGVFARGMVERLDDELDRASAALLSDYTRLVHANMSEEIDVFVRAMELDLIGVADFQQ